MRRLLAKWLPDYCADPKRGYAKEGFPAGETALTEEDARDFLRALNSDVAGFGERQFVKVGQRVSSETLFSEGRKMHSPRRPTLWLETVITVAAAARLHLDYGWPIDLLGMQSKDNAFDLMTFRAPDFTNEDIACEVKKATREVDVLLRNLALCCAGDHDESCLDAGKRRNAHKKWVALHARKPRLFWAVGPFPDSRVFEVMTIGDDIQLREMPATALAFRE